VRRLDCHAWRLRWDARSAFPEEWRRAAAENAQAALADFRIAVGGYPSAKELAVVTRPVLAVRARGVTGHWCAWLVLWPASSQTAQRSEIQGAAHAAAFDAQQERSVKDGEVSLGLMLISGRGLRQFG
jgi:hypothetical protein